MARIFLQPSGDDGKEATLRLQGDYAADIRMFDRIETEALRMAAYMFCGLAMRCRLTHERSPPGCPRKGALFHRIVPDAQRETPCGVSRCM